MLDKYYPYQNSMLIVEFYIKYANYSGNKERIIWGDLVLDTYVHYWEFP